MTPPAVITEFTVADLTEVGTLELRSGDYWFLGGELHRISKLAADDRGVTFVCRGKRVTVLEWGQRHTIRKRQHEIRYLRTKQWHPVTYRDQLGYYAQCAECWWSSRTYWGPGSKAKARQEAEQHLNKQAELGAGAEFQADGGA